MSELIKYDAMCRAIDAAYEVDEVKDIRNQARALETYARLAQNVEAERRACEIRLRSERKAGQLLSSMEKDKGGRPSANRSDRPSGLPDLGITKQQSSDWQKLAKAPDDEFEAALADRTAMPSTSGIIRATSEPKQTAVSTEALWLAGRLRDFEENGILRMTPAEVMQTMTPTMKDLVHSIAPRVAMWLKQIGALQ